MVGTALNQVGRNASSHWKNRRGSSRGAQTTADPAASEAINTMSHGCDAGA
jgi:hypothetical protein